MICCSVDGCGRPVKARSLCGTHYWRWSKHGDVGAGGLLVAKPGGTCSKHPDRPVKAKGLCGSCYNKHLDERDPANKEKLLKRRRETWANRYSSRNSEEHARKHKNRVLKHRYGITYDEYQRMHNEQNHCCAICGKEGGSTRSTRLYVDHNHETGQVRMLLCPKCNIAVGVIEEGLSRVISIAQYLTKHDPGNESWNALARLELMLRAEADVS